MPRFGKPKKRIFLGLREGYIKNLFNQFWDWVNCTYPPGRKNGKKPELVVHADLRQAVGKTLFCKNLCDFVIPQRVFTRFLNLGLLQMQDSPEVTFFVANDFEFVEPKRKARRAMRLDGIKSKKAKELAATMANERPPISSKELLRRLSQELNITLVNQNLGPLSHLDGGVIWIDKEGLVHPISERPPEPDRKRRRRSTERTRKHVPSSGVKIRYREKPALGMKEDFVSQRPVQSSEAISLDERMRLHILATTLLHKGLKGVQEHLKEHPEDWDAGMRQEYDQLLRSMVGMKK